MYRSELDQSNESSNLYGEEVQAGELAQSLPVIETVIEKIEHQHYGRVPDAEAVISKVIEVAESNRTIERILERKHEVKDLASPKSQSQQPGAAIDVANNDTRLNIQPIQTVSPSIYATTKTPLKDLVMGNTLYGYAIRYGFVSALLALLAATLTVTLFT